jgi:hypothetical protein
LNLQCPRRSVALRDVVVEILSGIVRVDLESISFRSSKILDTLISLEMELNPVSFTLVINPLESVGRITVHSSETIRGTSVREQDSHLERKAKQKSYYIPSRNSKLR